jgi:hypothetical protein
MRSRVDATLNLGREFNGGSITRTLKNLLAVKCVRELYFIILKERCIIFLARQLRKINKSKGLIHASTYIFKNSVRIRME